MRTVRQQVVETALELGEGEQRGSYEVRGPLRAEQVPAELRPAVEQATELGFTDLEWHITGGDEPELTIWGHGKFELKLPAAPPFAEDAEWKLPAEVTVFVGAAGRSDVVIYANNAGDGYEVPGETLRPEAWAALEALREAAEPHAVAMLQGE